MDLAHCLLDRRDYTAVQFQQLTLPDLGAKRRNLVCITCGQQAFFRKPSADGRAACFGARPHAAGCSMAAEDALRVESAIGPDEAIIRNTDVLVVDFNFGAVQGAPHLQDSDQAGAQGRGGRHVAGAGQRTARPHRRLSTLLKHLRSSAAFGTSNQPIEIGGIANRTLRNFFVEFAALQPRHFSQVVGCWGMIAYAGAGNGITWLNSGGRGDISIGIPDAIGAAFTQRFQVTDLEDLAGAYVLAIGTPWISQQGKKCLIVDDIEFVTASLT